MKEWKKNLAIFLLFLWAFIAVIVSAGSTNYAFTTKEHIYTVCAALNIIITALYIYKASKEIK